MKKYFNKALKDITSALEITIAFILAAAICIMLFQLLSAFAKAPQLDYDTLLTNCFNLIIGVEMIRMLYMHTPSTIFEVLIFAVARQIIIDHSSPWNSLIGILSIAILFATRKFLFVAFDESEKTIFRANQKVYHVNKLLHVHIPYEKYETLEDVILRKLEEEDIDVGVGACAYYNDFGLRIAKMENGKITRVELIRSIH